MKLRKRRPNQVSLDEEIDTGEDTMPREVEDWGPSPEDRYEQTEFGEYFPAQLRNSTHLFESFSNFATSKNYRLRRRRKHWGFRSQQ